MNKVVYALLVAGIVTIILSIFNNDYSVKNIYGRFFIAFFTVSISEYFIMGKIDKDLRNDKLRRSACEVA